MTDATAEGPMSLGDACSDLPHERVDLTPVTRTSVTQS